ncbi:hypothetical protein Golob_023635, partial [Gossypium lobatum]|nr:hypothetical protein [Gossypium lobatum]
MVITKTRTFILSVVYLVGTKQWTSRPAREEDHCIHLDCDGIIIFFFIVLSISTGCRATEESGSEWCDGLNYEDI